MTNEEISNTDGSLHVVVERTDLFCRTIRFRKHILYGYYLSYRKEGGGFVHKSALIENVLRTLTIRHVLIDLDELSIFCDGTWSPQRFLIKFYPL